MTKQSVTTDCMFPVIFCLQSFFTGANEQSITWTFESRRTSIMEATIYLKASIGLGWHLYSQTLPEGGPLKTSFTFNTSKSFTLIGEVVEPRPIIKYEKYFDMNVGYFENVVVFQQEIKLDGETALVNGAIRFMVCSEKVCLPPQTIEFSITVD